MDKEHRETKNRRRRDAGLGYVSGWAPSGRAFKIMEELKKYKPLVEEADRSAGKDEDEK